MLSRLVSKPSIYRSIHAATSIKFNNARFFSTSKLSQADQDLLKTLKVFNPALAARIEQDPSNMKQIMAEFSNNPNVEASTPSVSNEEYNEKTQIPAPPSIRRVTPEDLVKFRPMLHLPGIDPQGNVVWISVILVIIGFFGVLKFDSYLKKKEIEEIRRARDREVEELRVQAEEALKAEAEAEAANAVSN